MNKLDTLALRLVAAEGAARERLVFGLTTTEMNALLSQFGKAPLKGRTEAARKLLEVAKARAAEARPVTMGEGFE